MSNKIILFQDDDEKVLFNLTLYLEDEGFECRKFTSGEEAIDFLQNNRCDAIIVAIVDIRLPGMSGEEFIEKAKKITPELFVILHTGINHFKVPPKLAQLGIDQNDIFTKPIVNLNLLAGKIRKKIKQ